MALKYVPNRKNIPKELLSELYINQRLSIREIERRTGFDETTVWSYLHRYQIPTRSRHVITQPRSPELRHRISLGVKRWLATHEHPRGMLGKSFHHTIETRQRISQSKIGHQMPEEGRKKLSETRKRLFTEGKLTSPFENPLNRCRKKITKPTKPEKKFIEICNKHKLPFRYTGNGAFWIENINPDFVEVNGKKICIEIFGDYWHTPLLRPYMNYDYTEPGRKQILKKYGWKCIILWQSPLMAKSGEEYALKQLKGNGIRLNATLHS